MIIWINNESHSQTVWDEIRLDMPLNSINKPICYLLPNKLGFKKLELFKIQQQFKQVNLFWKSLNYSKICRLFTKKKLCLKGFIVRWFWN